MQLRTRINCKMADNSSAHTDSQAESNFLYSPGVTSEVAHEVELSEEREQSRTGRKRQRNPNNWKIKHVKRPGLRKNSPLIVISGEMECCKKKCLQNFSVSHLEKVRSEFQGLFYESQNTYLHGLLHRRQTKKTSGHARKTNPSTSSGGKRLGRPPAEESQFSFEYTIRNENGINVHVCQKAFCSVHGFGPKRLQVLRRKVQSSHGGPEPDKRGRHGCHPKVGEDLKQHIREHIKSYPTRHSHYSRKDNSERVYLSGELSIARLYREFLEKHDPEYMQLEEDNRQRMMRHEPVEELRKPLVSEHMYHDIFVTEFNIHFGYPRSDSCSTCDGLKVQIEAATEADKPPLQTTLQQHHQLAEEGYQAFRYDRELSKKSWANNRSDYSSSSS